MGPLWSPDGRFLLFVGVKVREQGRPDWWVAPVNGGPAVSTGASSLPRVGFVQIPSAWVGSHVLVAAGATMEGVNLHRVRISPGDFKVTGPLEPLTSGTGVSYLASVAADGRMAIPRFNWLVQLWSIDAGPGGGSASPAPEALTHDAAPKFGFSLARDAPWMAYTAYTGSGGRHRIEVRLRDLARGGETTPIQTSARSITLNPYLSADGALLSWEDEVDGQWAAIVGKAGDSSGREVCRDCSLAGFFSDSRHVLAGIGPRRLVQRDLEGGAETPLLELETGAILDTDVSWDDRWLAVTIGRPDGTIALQVVPVGERAGSADGVDPGRRVGARPGEPPLVARREPALLHGEPRRFRLPLGPGAGPRDEEAPGRACRRLPRAP